MKGISKITVLAAGMALWAVAGVALELGEQAQGFMLPGTDGRFHSLEELKGEKATAVIFTCNHCPFAVAYQGRIKAFADDYGDRGVRVVAINPNDSEAFPGDGFEQMKQRAREERYNFPYLLDRTQETAAAYGAVCTPHVFLLDAALRLRYEGRIDDSWRDENKVKARDLREAIDLVLQGKKVGRPVTRPMGCSIKWTRPGHKPQVPFTIAPSAAGTTPLDKGDTLPNALVSDMQGNAVWLHERVKGAPTVLIVFRGGWCPYCTKHLSGLQAVHGKLKELGYRVVAISPDTPQGTLDGTQKAALDYELLSDPTMEAILALGLAFRLDDDTVTKYAEWKLPLRSPPGRADKVLPVPAVYLLDKDGRIIFGHTNPDYKKRLDPNQLIETARESRKR